MVLHVPSATADRTPLRMPEAFLHALHPPGSRGKVSLLAKIESGVVARCYTATEVDPVLPTWLEMTAYIALNRYAGPRGGGRPVVELTCLYADLDTYRQSEFMFSERSEIEETILGRIVSYGLPAPSVLVDSGRGFYAIWLIEPLSGRAIPRWQAAQRCLVERLAPLGADPACCDAARVLRIPGTLNGKAGRMVSIVGGDGHRHRFGDLADAIYCAAGRPTRRRLAARRRSAETADDAPKAVRGLPPAMRFAAALRDLERVRAAWGGEIPEGLRNTWLHLVATALGFVMPADEVEGEARRLAALGTPGLPESEIKATLKAATRRAEAVAGRFQGPATDPRLHYSGDRMAEILGIERSMAETLELEQILPDELRRDRRNAARRARRESSGGQSRDAYLAGNRVSRERPWEALGMPRSTWYARGLHKAGPVPTAPTDASSTSQTSWTGAVPQQGALGAAEGPERSSRNSDNPEPTPGPPGGPTESPSQPTTAPSQRPGPTPRPGGPEDATARRGVPLGHQGDILGHRDASGASSSAGTVNVRLGKPPAVGARSVSRDTQN